MALKLDCAEALCENHDAAREMSSPEKDVAKAYWAEETYSARAQHYLQNRNEAHIDLAMTTRVVRRYNSFPRRMLWGK